METNYLSIDTKNPIVNRAMIDRWSHPRSINDELFWNYMKEDEKYIIFEKPHFVTLWTYGQF
jgi:hypothetical protein